MPAWLSLGVALASHSRLTLYTVLVYQRDSLCPAIWAILALHSLVPECLLGLKRNSEFDWVDLKTVLRSLLTLYFLSQMRMDGGFLDLLIVVLLDDVLANDFVVLVGVFLGESL